MRIVLRWLAAMVMLCLPAATDAQPMDDCRAKPKVLELGAPLAAARKAIAEHKKLRILTISSSATESYGVSNPAYA
jgi:acyl-CoA thioesterase I